MQNKLLHGGMGRKEEDGDSQRTGGWGCSCRWRGHQSALLSLFPDDPQSEAKSSVLYRKFELTELSTKIANQPWQPEPVGGWLQWVSFFQETDREGVEGFGGGGQPVLFC